MKDLIKQSLDHGMSRRQLRRMIRGLIEGFRAIPSVQRHPVPRETFALDRRLRRKGAQRLADLTMRLAVNSAKAKLEKK